MRKNHRIIALLLAVLMFLSSTQFVGLVLSVAADDETTTKHNLIIRDDALHFIVRHWHTDFDPDATQQGKSEQQDGDDWFVVVEGYIVKLRPGDDGYHETVTDPITGKEITRNFQILLVKQSTGELVLASEQDSPYLGAFKREEGTLTLNIKPLRETNPLYKEGDDSQPQYVDHEKYCGTSMSAGRKALDKEYDAYDAEGNGIGPVTGLTIKYGDGNTHIVKAHVFYSSWHKTVPGTNNPAVFDENDEEIDTAAVYTWAKEFTDAFNEKHDVGDVITYEKTETTDNGEEDVTVACWTKDDLKEAADKLMPSEYEGSRDDFIAEYFSAEPKKFYSTNEGLHTNKTLVQEGDTGRLFLADLEAWYIEGYAPQVGFVLDASGSMAFVSEPPAKVNVYTALAKRLDIKITQRQEDDDVYYTYTYKSEAGKEYPSSEYKNDAENNYAKLGEFILDLANNHGFLDEFLEVINDKLDHIHQFDKDEWELLFERIGKLDKLLGDSYVYPQHDKIIGYYTFDGVSAGGVTHTLDASTLSTFSSGKTAGDKTVAGDGNYFTIIWRSDSKVESARMTWSDYTSTNRINFGGGMNGYNGSINFTTTNPATVKVWWASSGASARHLQIIDDSGAVVANTPDSTNTNSQYTELGLEAPGEYYLGSAASTIYIYKIEVMEVSENDTTLKNNAPNANDKYASLVARQNSSGAFSFDTKGVASPVKDGQLVINGNSAAGIKLDAVPTSGSFTITFKINKSSSGDASGDQNPADVLYIGGLTNAGDYLRVIREGRRSGQSEGLFGSVQRAWLTGYQSTTHDIGEMQDDYKSAISAFNDSNARFVTYVYENGNLTSYYFDDEGKFSLNTTKNSGEIDATRQLKLDGFNFIFNGFNTGYNGAEIYIDNVYVYDAALTADEVKQLVDAGNEKKGINDKTAATVDWNDVFILDDTVLAFLLNPMNTAHVPLGVAAYNYFVYDAYDPKDFNANSTGTATKEYAPLAYWNGLLNSADAAVAGEDVIGKPEQYAEYTGSHAGWYYLTHTSTMADIANYGTTKSLRGLDGTENASTIKTENGKVKDRVDLPGFKVGGTTDREDPAGTGATYTIEKHTPIRFYIDTNGDLRCFFSRGNKITTCSYVYELSDNQYVKTEALQRVLANFSTKLNERSPSSKISAVKFSTENFLKNAETVQKGLEQLVLLDWSNDPEAVAGIMSQKIGKGTASEHEACMHGVEQYNYFLTGSTVAYTGLRAFRDVLLESPSIKEVDDAKSEKFLVVFTDGADNSIGNEKDEYKKQSETYAIAKELREERGFTIITVYLPCGPAVNPDGTMNPKSTEFQNAQKFLSELASKDDDGNPFFFASTDVTTLSKIFEEQILSRIVDTMEDYIVQDYIDPRFDLMEETVDGDVVWHLNAGGNVVQTDTNGKVINSFNVLTDVNPETKDFYTFHLTRQATTGARDPYLGYDNTKDMYYLKWVGQTIPSTPIGSKDLLPVWTAEFLLRAKDDFIGGNAILTNGNDANMNWVFHPYDSSNAAEREAYKQDLLERLDKGFDAFTTVQKSTYVSEYANELELTETQWTALTPAEQAKVKKTYIEKTSKAKLKTSGGDPSSGTGDMRKAYEQKTVDGKQVNDLDKPRDEYPSKGFPRTVADVRLLPIYTDNIHETIYMGEGISPRLMLTELEDDSVTDIYFLDYLKRYAYAYQGYKNADVALMALLDLWLELDNDTAFEKEFSLPYMYLPSYEYDTAQGRFVGEQLNSTGGANTHEKDVVGILTYRWVRLDRDENGQKQSPIKDYVKSDTKPVEYALTVEYTPLYRGDVWGALTECGFFRYVPLDDTPVGDNGKAEFGDEYLFDRSAYVNELIVETEKGKDVYKWNPVYKPVVGNQQLEDEPATDPDIYGNAERINNNRTLRAHATYGKQAVSGGIALELRMLIGELRELKKALADAAAEKAALTRAAGDEEFTFTVTAERAFTDTPLIEWIKAGKNEWEDYGSEFIFTFVLDYQNWKPDELQKDENGYVSIFIGTSDIKTTFGGTDTHITELPIGTYTFKSAEINAGLEGVIGKYIHFASAGIGETFDADYFDKDVLEGLGTEDENQINNDNIEEFIAEANASGDNVYFYVGTTAKGPSRGNADAETEKNDYYINDRLAMLKLATGTVRVTIKETNDKEGTENFIYHVTGMTLGDVYVDFYVSVTGNDPDGTTIEILPGDYQIDECDTWAWKYKNVDTWGMQDEGWIISKENLTHAETTLRYRNDFPLADDKTVTYEHSYDDDGKKGEELQVDNIFNRPGTTTGGNTGS